MAVPFISFSSNDYYHTERKHGRRRHACEEKKKRGARLVAFENRNLNYVKSSPQDKQEQLRSLAHGHLCGLEQFPFRTRTNASARAKAPCRPPRQGNASPPGAADRRNGGLPDILPALYRSRPAAFASACRSIPLTEPNRAIPRRL